MLKKFLALVPAMLIIQASIACDLVLSFDFWAGLKSPLKRYAMNVYRCDLTAGTFETRIDSGVVFKGNVLDCTGALQFQLIDSVAGTIIQGAFVAGLDTLKRQILVEDPITAQVRPELEYYFQPLPNGKWTYSRLDGSFLGEMFYEKGSYNGPSSSGLEPGLEIH